MRDKKITAAEAAAMVKDGTSSSVILVDVNYFDDRNVKIKYN